MGKILSIYIKYIYIEKAVIGQCTSTVHSITVLLILTLIFNIPPFFTSLHFCYLLISSLIQCSLFQTYNNELLFISNVSTLFTC